MGFEVAVGFWLEGGWVVVEGDEEGVWVSWLLSERKGGREGGRWKGRWAYRLAGLLLEDIVYSSDEGGYRHVWLRWRLRKRLPSQVSFMMMLTWRLG
jgi:hypothetical protein